MSPQTPTLEIQNGKYKGRRVKLSDAETVFGRGEEARVKISSAEVSREHCVLVRKNNDVIVRDLNSRNGTFIDGRPITGEQPLQPGSTLTVGPLTFLLLGERPAATGATGPGAAILGKAGVDQGLSDDDIASWLSHDELPTAPSPTSDTTIIKGNKKEDKKDDSSGTIDIPAFVEQPKKREFRSTAEEAQDIIRRHFESLAAQQ